ncbi:MAG: YigZ family protein [Bacteroidales bacterium]|jgi:uncharacterized YigZ family protein|nr:YigZ family protein [Bacteroidales bacterium]
MQTETFQTITKPSTGLFKDKGSKFIAYAQPVGSIDEITKHIERIKKEHHSARHYCWAYRIGFRGEEYRVQDDGEPVNSAGKPILGQIDAFSLTQVLIVVVRYFGGTLLGVGGLIQAYKQASKDALDSANISTQHIPYPITISCTYEHYPHLMNILSGNNCTISNEEYNNTRCKIDCEVDKTTLTLLEREKNLYTSLKIKLS